MAEIIWWAAFVGWIGVTIWLWVLAARAAKRDDKARKQREDVIEDQRILLMIAEFITQCEAKKAASDLLSLPTVFDLSDCANEPDLEFQLRRSVEIAKENNNHGSAA